MIPHPLHAAWSSLASLFTNHAPEPHRVLLVVVEGPHDVEFLRRISTMLHVHQPELPDLRNEETKGHVVFLPIGGGDLVTWTRRLAPLRQPEFFLLDRELPPVTYERLEMAAVINQRPGCHAFVTNRCCLESYLHPDAVREACGAILDITDDSDVPELMARHMANEQGLVWEHRSWRAHKRLRGRAKHVLNTIAVERMSVERLGEVDPQGEVLGWLRQMARMLEE